MRKTVIKVLVMLAIIVAILLHMKVGNAATFLDTDVVEKYKDTYIVPYGKEITIQKDENETIVSDNLDIAKIENDKMKIVGTGHFTISINGEKINFFAWNAYLKDAKYIVYSDKDKKNRDGRLKAKTYLAVSTVGSYKTLEIKEYLFKTGSYNGELKGKYIEGYYDEKTKQSKTDNYKYSFEDDFVKILLDKDELTITEGEKATLVATVEPEDLADKKVAFSSSNESIAKVNENGEITAVKAGEATITAEIRGKKATCDVTVKAKEVTSNAPETSTIEENLEMYFLNVTKPNDAILIKVGKKSIFIDGGHYQNAEKVIIPYLTDLGVTKIDYYIGTHSHEEHVGAAGPLIKKYGIKKIYVSEATINKKYAYVKDSYFAGSKVTLTDAMRTSATYNQIYKAISDGKISGKTSKEQKEIKNAERKAVANCKVGILKHGKEINIGNLKITCLGPVNPKAEQDIESNSNKTSLINNNSLILRLDYGEKSFLLTGDAGNSELKDACEKYKEKVSVDLYKNGGHNSAKTEAIMNNISPQYTIFETVDYKLPSQNFLDMIAKIGNSKYTYQNGYKPYYITAGGKDGNILVTSNGKKIEIKTHYKEKNIIPIDSITLRNITIRVGEKVTLTSYTTIRPSYATDKTIEYTSSNPDVARIIGDNGIVLEALKEGKTVITAKVDGGKKTSSVEVTVTNEKLEVHFINTRADKIGSRSDAIFIKAGNKSMIIDGGLYDQAQTVINYIKKLGVKKVNYYVGSHAHKDHIGAAGQLIKEFKISKMYVSKAEVSDGKYSKNATVNRMLLLTKENAKGTFKKQRELSAIKNCPIKELKDGDEIKFNGVTIKCIGPINPVTTKVGETFITNNRNSLLLRLDFGKNSFLFSGDAGTMSRDGSLVEYEEANEKYPGNLDVDVYKNGHHGNPKSEQIVNWITPKYTVFLTDSLVDCPKTNTTAEGYLKLLEKVKSKQYIVSSKYNGHVVFESDGNKLTVKAEKEEKKISLSNVSIKVGKEKKLEPKIIPVTSEDIKITWKSSDSKIATVSKDGIVKGIKKGKATITAEAKGYEKATCTVTVKDNIKMLFVGNSKTQYSKYREDCIQIATQVGYKFDGKDSTEPYAWINIHNTKSKENAFYSLAKGGASLNTIWKYIEEEKNTEIMKALKETDVDYAILQLGGRNKATEENDYLTYTGARNIITTLVQTNPDIKIYIRNIWWRYDTNQDDINKAYQMTKKVISDLNNEKICKNEIKIINNAFPMYDAYHNSHKVFKDDVHQSNLGAYLAALVTDATVFGIDIDAAYVPDFISAKVDEKEIKEIKDIAKKYLNWDGEYTFTPVPKEGKKILFLGNSKTHQQLYREYVVSIANQAKGIKFIGKPAVAKIHYTLYEDSYFDKNKIEKPVLGSYYTVSYKKSQKVVGAYLDKKVTNKDLQKYAAYNFHSVDTEENSYYSYTKGGKSSQEKVEILDGSLKNYKQQFKDLDVDYIVLQEDSDVYKKVLNAKSDQAYAEAIKEYIDGVDNLLKLCVFKEDGKTLKNKDIKIYVRNVWVSSKKSIGLNHQDITEAVINGLNERYCKSTERENLKNNIEMINDGAVISELYDYYEAQQGKTKAILKDSIHQSYLGAYAAAIIANNKIFGVSTKEAINSYIPEQLYQYRSDGKKPVTLYDIVKEEKFSEIINKYMSK